MADLKITEKRSGGSLTRRVLLIATLLLVIPLFWQTLFLYRQEYQQKLKDVELDLHILVNERAYFLDEMIQFCWDWLKLIPEDQDFSDSKVQKTPLSSFTSDPFVAMDEGDKALLAGIPIDGFSALVTPISFSFITSDLPRTYQIHMALIDEKGETLWQSGEKSQKEYLEAKDQIGKTNLFLVLSAEKDKIKGLHLESYYLRFASLLFFVGLIGGAIVFLFAKRIARPLRQLCQVMARVKEGAVHTRYQPDWMGFEINALGIQFNAALDGLLHHASEAEKEKIQRERLAKELSIGHEIQKSLVPDKLSSSLEMEMSSAYLAAQEVNGDFYDLFELPDQRLMIVICDTAGKGISACLFALGLRSVLRSLSLIEEDVAEIVRKANDLYLKDAHASSMFSTVWIGIYDPQKEEISYCSQGHPPALLFRSFQLEELWTEGIALGAQKIDIIRKKVISIQKGDLLVLYSDGVIEAHNPNQELFGKKRFYDLISEAQSQSTHQIVRTVLDEIERFSQKRPQHDDLSLVVLRF